MTHYQDVCDYVLYKNFESSSLKLQPSRLLQIPSVLDITRQRVNDDENYPNHDETRFPLTFPTFEGLPTVSFPSDHLPLMVEFEFF